jgi:hypothetical protein
VTLQLHSIAAIRVDSLADQQSTRVGLYRLCKRKPFTYERTITGNFLGDKNSMRSAVAYIRVSKPKEGRSGLGLEAQQAAIKTFCAARLQD